MYESEAVAVLCVSAERKGKTCSFIHVTCSFIQCMVSSVCQECDIDTALVIKNRTYTKCRRHTSQDI